MGILLLIIIQRGYYLGRFLFRGGYCQQTTGFHGFCQARLKRIAKKTVFSFVSPICPKPDKPRQKPSVWRYWVVCRVVCMSRTVCSIRHICVPHHDVPPPTSHLSHHQNLEAVAEAKPVCVPPARQAVLRLGTFIKNLVTRAELCDGTTDAEDFKEDLRKYVVDAAIKLTPPHLAPPDLGVARARLNHLCRSAFLPAHSLAGWSPEPKAGCASSGI